MRMKPHYLRTDRLHPGWTTLMRTAEAGLCGFPGSTDAVVGCGQMSSPVIQLLVWNVFAWRATETQKTTGYVYTFDPLPENNSGTSFVPLVKRWLADIEAAIKAHRPVKATKTVGGAWEV